MVFLMTLELPVSHIYLSGGETSPQAPYESHYVLSETEDELLQRRFGLYYGSGGSPATLIGVDRSGTNTHWIVPPRNKVASSVNEIRWTFGLTKNDMSDILDVTRMTLHNWERGSSKPQKETLHRIYALLTAARAWQSSGFATRPEDLRVPIAQGRSLLELLSQPEIDRDLVLFAGSRLTLGSALAEELADPFA